MKRIAVIIASVCYLGRCPLAPGTVGTLVGLLVYLAMAMAGLSWPAYILITAALFALGVWASTITERELGRKDPPQVIIDELVGYLVTMLGIHLSFKAVVIGFILNRILDIIKPYPAGRMQRLGGGIGVMGDDLTSSIYANILLRIWGQVSTFHI